MPSRYKGHRWYFSIQNFTQDPLFHPWVSPEHPEKSFRPGLWACLSSHSSSASFISDHFRKIPYQHCSKFCVSYFCKQGDNSSESCGLCYYRSQDNASMGKVKWPYSILLIRTACVGDLKHLNALFFNVTIFSRKKQAGPHKGQQ